MELTDSYYFADVEDSRYCYKSTSLSFFPLPLCSSLLQESGLREVSSGCNMKLPKLYYVHITV